MKKLLLLALLAAGGMNAQTTLFEDSFDTYSDFIITGIGGWTMTDVDARPTYGFTGLTFPNTGVAKSFQVFNSTQTVNTTTMAIDPIEPTDTSDWTARTGDKAMVCFAAVPNGPHPNNDDWMISPQITLAASGNELSFWAKSCDAEYGDETFDVLISTTGTATTDFIPIEEMIYSPADITYYEYTYGLDDWAGQQVYIAIRCTSADMFGFMVDDFKVTTTLLGTPNFFNRNFAAYPNPASSVLNIDSKNGVDMQSVRIIDLNGRTMQQQAVQGEHAQINMSALATGAYFLEVQSSHGTATQKIIRN